MDHSSLTFTSWGERPYRFHAYPGTLVGVNVIKRKMHPAGIYNMGNMFWGGTVDNGQPEREFYTGSLMFSEIIHPNALMEPFDVDVYSYGGTWECSIYNVDVAAMRLYADPFTGMLVLWQQPSEDMAGLPIAFRADDVADYTVTPPEMPWLNA